MTSVTTREGASSREKPVPVASGRMKRRENGWRLFRAARGGADELRRKVEQSEVGCTNVVVFGCNKVCIRHARD